MDRQRHTTPEPTRPSGDPGLLEFVPAVPQRRTPAAAGPSCVTADGAEWLAGASVFPASVRALWRHRPASPSVLPCGRAFDVVSAAPLPGRRILDRLWTTGPGSGPVAVHRGRVLVFAAPGTARRLSALLNWEEWRQPRDEDGGRPHGDLAETFPPLLCHGPGDYVTVPALTPRNPDVQGGGEGNAPFTMPDRHSRWLVGPDLRDPWLPGPGALLRACLPPARHGHSRASVRAGRGSAGPGESNFGTADRDARVYDVTRRR